MKDATDSLLRLSVPDKNELLFKRGINFNRLPAWQKRGIGVYWEDYEKEGFNPKLGTSTKAVRRRLKVDMELPIKDAYDGFIAGRLENRTVP